MIEAGGTDDGPAAPDDEDDQGYWPEDAGMGNQIDLAAALKAVEAKIWSAKRPAPSGGTGVVDVVEYMLNRPQSGVIDPPYEPQSEGAGGAPDPGRGPDYDPRLKDPVVIGPRVGPGGVDPVAQPMGRPTRRVAGGLARGLRTLADWLERDR